MDRCQRLAFGLSRRHSISKSAYSHPGTARGHRMQINPGSWSNCLSFHRSSPACSLCNSWLLHDAFAHRVRQQDIEVADVRYRLKPLFYPSLMDNLPSEHQGSAAVKE